MSYSLLYSHKKKEKEKSLAIFNDMTGTRGYYAK